MSTISTHRRTSRPDPRTTPPQITDRNLVVGLWRRLRREGVELSAEFSVILIEGGKR